MNLRASPEKSCASTPITTTPCAAVLLPRGLQPRRLRLARIAPRGPEVEHDDLAAQRRELRACRCASSRDRSNCGAAAASPRRAARDALVLVDDLPDEQGEQAEHDERRTQPAGRASAARARAELCRDDVDRRADVDVVEQPLGLRDVHPDAAVRGRVAERGRIGRAVDADARRREAHPARAERVARARRDRLRALRPRRVRRIPPRVLPLDDDLEACRAASGRSPGRSRRRTSATASSRGRDRGGSCRGWMTITEPKFARVIFCATSSYGSLISVRRFSRSARDDRRDRALLDRAPSRAAPLVMYGFRLPEEELRVDRLALVLLRERGDELAARAAPWTLTPSGTAVPGADTARARDRVLRVRDRAELARATSHGARRPEGRAARGTRRGRPRTAARGESPPTWMPPIVTPRRERPRPGLRLRLRRRRRGRRGGRRLRWRSWSPRRWSSSSSVVVGGDCAEPIGTTAASTPAAATAMTASSDRKSPSPVLRLSTRVRS